MTTSITIRDVPDETRDELAARAALSGRSLQEYLRARLVRFQDTTHSMRAGPARGGRLPQDAARSLALSHTVNGLTR
jgi:hypothetical protein